MYPFNAMRSNARAFSPSDPQCWMQRGRTKTAAFAIAKVWQDFPDLENEAPLVDRQARVRQRTQALRPLFDKIAEAQNRVQEAKNFAFIAQKIAEGTASSTDILIDQAKAAYAYSWPEAVQYAQGRYAAQHGWPYRQAAHCNGNASFGGTYERSSPVSRMDGSQLAQGKP